MVAFALAKMAPPPLAPVVELPENVALVIVIGPVFAIAPPMPPPLLAVLVLKVERVRVKLVPPL